MRRRLAAIMLAAGAAVAAVAARAAAQEPVPLGSELEDYVRMLQLDGLARPAPFVIRSFSANATAGLTADSAHLWDWRYSLQAQESETGLFEQTGIPQLVPIVPELQTVYNSAYPRGVNDGATWAGKGATAIVSGGVQVKWGPLTGTLFPTVYYAENRDFPIVPVSDTGVSEFAYPWHKARIDWPQRFGNEAFTEFPHPRSPEGIIAYARKRGMEVGLEAAEAFMIVRDIWT